MWKKRRVLLIAGGLGVIIVLFASIAFFLDYISLERKLERAVAHLVEEYGFERLKEAPDYVMLADDRTTSVFYTRDPLESETTDKIVAMLRNAHPSCKHLSYFYDEDMAQVATKSSEVVGESHSVLFGEQHRGGSGSVSLIPDDHYMHSSTDSVAILIQMKVSSPSPWERIRGLWPW